MKKEGSRISDAARSKLWRIFREAVGWRNGRTRGFDAQCLLPSHRQGKNPVQPETGTQDQNTA